MNLLQLTGSFGRSVGMAWTWLRWKLVVLMLLNVLTALVESVGILLFLPFFSRLGVASPETPATGWMGRFFELFGNGLSLGAGLGVLVGIFVLKGVLVYAAQVYRRMILNAMELHLREELVHRVSVVNASSAQRLTTGDFGHLVVHETSTAHTAVESLCGLLGNLVTSGVLVIAALLLDPLLSAFVLLSSGLSLLILRRLSRGVRMHSKTITRLEGRLNTFLIEALQAFPYLKATHRFNVLRAQLTSTAGRVREERNRMDRVGALHLAIEEPILVSLIAVMFYGATQWLLRSVSTVMVSLALFYRCMIEMRLIQHRWQSVSAHAGGLDAVWNALSELEKNREPPEGQTEVPAELSFQFEQVSFAYEETPVFQEVSFTIPANRITAFVGASGAGKTTLIRLLTGYLRPAAGTIRVGDHPLETLQISSLRKRIGYVPQEPVIFTGSVSENISLHLDEEPQVHAEDLEHAARLAHCHEVITALPKGYSTWLTERGQSLSGGQRQRLAIARELYRKPQLLILDEAASALDSGSEQHIQKSLEDLKGTMTMVVISHRLSTIRNADVIHVLDQGRILASGTFEELRDQCPLFRTMCEHQHLM